MDNTTIIGQGVFTASSYGLSNPNAGNASVSNAVATTIQIPSNADWVSVRNWTQFGTAANNACYFNGSATVEVNTGVEYYWQRGMAAGSAIVKYYLDDENYIGGDTIVSGGFTLYDPSGQSIGAQPLIGNPVATTASTNATRPVVSTANTSGISVGTVVRMSNTAQTDVNGVDMVVGAVVSGTSFTLLGTSNALANAPGAIGGAGYYRVVFNGNIPAWYPARRYITNITQANNAQVSTSVAHGLTPGQSIRFDIPNQSGMTQLNPQQNNNYFPQSASTNAIVVSVVDDYNFTININTTSYTAFSWPTIAQEPCNFPTYTPFGEDTATALATNAAQTPTVAGQQIFNTNTGILADSTVNTGYYGMILGIGGVGTYSTPAIILGPAGSIAWTAGNVPTGDTLYWVAGKSTYGGL